MYQDEKETGQHGDAQERNKSTDDLFELVWRPEARTPDMEATEKVWKMIDASLGRIRRDEDDERGQWVLVRTSRQGHVSQSISNIQPFKRSQEDGDIVLANDLANSASMRSLQSRPMRASESGSHDGSIRSTGQLRRTARVPVVRSGSRQSDEGVDDHALIDQRTRADGIPRAHRLDSDIVQALAMLQADYDTPSLVSALELTGESDQGHGPHRTLGGILMESPQSSSEIGLGLGMSLRLDSIYSSSTRSSSVYA